MATTRATWAYRDRFGDGFGRTYFRRFGPGVVSSVGLGTYLGDPTDAVDEAYERALIAGLDGGCNVIDTAVNYRCGRSERVVGRAVERADVDRDAVVVATKGGFLPFDGDRPADPAAYVRETYVEDGPVDPADLAAGYHCIAPDAVDALLDRSLDALGLEVVDCYYVHNPETQLRVRSREAVYDELEATFERLERRVAAGDIGRYGVATWRALRVPPDDDAHLSLPRIVECARSAAAAVGRSETGFEAIQLPFSVHMADAFTVRAHEFEGERRSGGGERPRPRRGERRRGDVRPARCAGVRRRLRVTAPAATVTGPTTGTVTSAGPSTPGRSRDRCGRRTPRPGRPAFSAPSRTPRT